jgi:hypothetical protein
LSPKRLTLGYLLLVHVVGFCQAALSQTPLSHVVYARDFGGVDACAQINSAIMSLPPTGGTVDATGITGAAPATAPAPGTVQCSTNPFAGIGVSQSGKLLLGNAIYSMSQTWFIPQRWRIYGIGRGGGTVGNTQGTTLQANTTATGNPSFSAQAITTGKVSTTQGSNVVTGGTGSNNPNWLWTISMANCTNGTVTVMLPSGTSPAGFLPGQVVTIASANPPGYNGTYVMVTYSAASGTPTFTYNLPGSCPANYMGSGTANVLVQDLFFASSQPSVSGTISISASGAVMGANTTFAAGSPWVGGLLTCTTGCGSNNGFASAIKSVADTTHMTLYNGVSVAAGAHYSVTLYTQGYVTAVTSATSLTLDVKAQQSIPSGTGYTIMPPMVAFQPGRFGTATGTSPITPFGASLEDVQIDCNNITACTGFQDWDAQEESWIQDINVSNYSGVAFNVETANAQNGGPFVNIVAGTGSGAVPTTMCFQILGVPAFHGISHSTCTSNGVPLNGFDINAQGFRSTDNHFEGFVRGVEIGDNGAANAITLINENGGAGAGPMTTVVDIANGASAAGLGVNLFGVILTSGVTNSIVDNIVGSSCGAGVTTLIDASVEEYSLGSSTSGNRTRTTSSPNAMDCLSVGVVASEGAAPTGLANADILWADSTAHRLKMINNNGSATQVVASGADISTSDTVTAIQGTAIGTVQGSSGNHPQLSSASSPASSNFPMYDASGNITDSGITSTNVANTVTFFANASGTAASSNISASSAITLWGYSLPSAVSTSQLTFWVANHDATGANQYNLGIYDSSGNKKVEVGATTASALLGSTNNVAKTASWTSSTTLLPGKYYFAAVTNCTSSCATLGGSPNGTFAQGLGTSTTTTGATLPSSIATPTDTWIIGAVPIIIIH